MPGLIVPPGYAQVKLLWTLTGDQEQICTTMGCTVPSGVTDPAVVAADVGLCWAASWPATATPSAYHFDGVWCQLGQDGGEGPISVSQTGNYQGTMSTLPPPQNVALLIKKQTATGGRKHRGRMFLPPILGTAGLVANGAVESGSRSAIQDRVNLFRANLTTVEGPGTNQYTPVIFHNNYGTLTPEPTVVTSFLVDSMVATQRRRLRH